MKILEAINDQLNFELESAYIYATMSSFLDDAGFHGMTHFMDKQAHEEMEHAEQFKHFLQSVGHKVVYQKLDPGKGEFEGFLDVFKKALDHEKLVTERIEKLYDLAQKENYKFAYSFLQDFIDEQREEECQFTEIIDMLETVQGDKAATFMVDQMLGKRE